MSSVQIFANVGDITSITQNGAESLIPHTFMAIIGPDGSVTTVGFQPTVTGVVGPGLVKDNTGHEFDASSGVTPISDTQYQKLKDYVDRTSINPPVYDIIGGMQCSTWVRSGLYESGIVNSLDTPIGMAFVDTLAYNPYMDALLLAISDFVNGIFTTAQRTAQYRHDPLTLDLNGDGIQTVPLSTPPLFFDLTASGIKTSVGWIAPSDGLLVMDRNGNGMIDSGAELFGDATPRYDAFGNPSNAKTADGFAALAQEDSNHDGIT